jgi:AcrR family transcriptional regulator
MSSSSDAKRSTVAGNGSSLGLPRGHTSIEERGGQILATATRLFSNRGYSATRLDDIAAELGVTRAALYYYFPRGKLEILELVCAAGMDGAEQVLRDAVSISDPVVAVESFFTTYAQHITSGEARVFFRETSELDPQFRRALLRRARSFTGTVVGLLQRGVDGGRFRDDFDPEVAANGLLGSLNWMSQWYHTARRAPSADAMGRQFAQLFLRGVVASGAVTEERLK